MEEIYYPVVGLDFNSMVEKRKERKTATCEIDRDLDWFDS